MSRASSTTIRAIVNKAIPSAKSVPETSEQLSLSDIAPIGLVPCELPIRVRNHRFDVHDGQALHLGPFEADLRLPGGADVQAGDSITILMEVVPPGFRGSGQMLVRQACVLNTVCEEVQDENPTEEDSLFLRVRVQWDKAIDHQFLV